MSWIISPYGIKNEKATINPINKKDNKCFQYAVTVTLNHKQIKKDPQKITKVKPFINKYNWEGIHFSSEKDHWKKFEKNIVTIALNVLYAKKESIYPAYVSKHNSHREKQVILLMIPNRNKQWHYLKRLSSLLREITSKNNGDFYCLNCLHSFRTRNKHEFHKRVCELKDFCNVIKPSEETENVRI